MTERRDLLRALWCAAKASGGTLRIGPSVQQDYPGDKKAMLTTYRDKDFGDLVIVAHGEEMTDDGRSSRSRAAPDVGDDPRANRGPVPSTDT